MENSRLYGKSSLNYSKFEIFQNFKLGIGFFSDFAKKVANVPKLTKFIYFEYHLSQFSSKSENVFCGLEGGRELITCKRSLFFSFILSFFLFLSFFFLSFFSSFFFLSLFWVKAETFICSLTQSLLEGTARAILAGVAFYSFFLFFSFLFRNLFIYSEQNQRNFFAHLLRHY